MIYGAKVVPSEPLTGGKSLFWWGYAEEENSGGVDWLVWNLLDF